VSTASVASARIRIGTREPSRRAVSPCVSNNTAERDPTQSQQTRPALDKQRAIKAIDRSLERGDRHNRKIRRPRLEPEGYHDAFEVSSDGLASGNSTAESGSAWDLRAYRERDAYTLFELLPEDQI
jgi:hypothetical protein